MVAGGLGWEGHEMEKENENENGESEEDKRFVEAMREAQPYISAYRDRTFVVVLHSEIVSNPNLDTILKVLCLLLSLPFLIVNYQVLHIDQKHENNK